jgi:phage protein D
MGAGVSYKDRATRRGEFESMQEPLSQELKEVQEVHEEKRHAVESDLSDAFIGDDDDEKCFVSHTAAKEQHAKMAECSGGLQRFVIADAS